MSLSNLPPGVTQRDLDGPKQPRCPGCREDSNIEPGELCEDCQDLLSLQETLERAPSSPVTDNPQEDAFYEKAEASIGHALNPAEPSIHSQPDPYDCAVWAAVWFVLFAAVMGGLILWLVL